MSVFFIKLAIRVAVFIAVFALVVWKSERIRVERKRVVPLVGLLFALLNVGLYGLLKPILNLATFGVASLVVPFVANGLFVYATGWLLQKVRVQGLAFDGVWPMVKLAVLLTVVQIALQYGLTLF